MYVTERMAISAGNGVENKAGVAAWPLNLKSASPALLASNLRGIRFFH